MYREYFGFQENPFSIAPDPHFIYMSERHREALAHLLFGMKSDGGFVLLTGEVGTGKTTICRCLLEQVPKEMDVAFILNPRVTTSELLAIICDEFDIAYPAGNRSIKIFVDAINSFLLDCHSKGRRAVLIIDEAQNLHPTVLEQVRLLTNLETTERKLLQIILLGQPELQKILAKPEVRQISQRVTARYHLGPLSLDEVAAYVSHRLSVAGIRQPLFPKSTLKTLYRFSGGIPRLINVICDRALLGTYVQGQHFVKKATLTTAAREVLGDVTPSPFQQKVSPWWALAAAVVLVIGAVVATDFYMKYRQGGTGAKVTADTSIAPPLASSDSTPLASVPEVAESSTKSLTWPEAVTVSLSKVMAFEALFSRWDVYYSHQEHGEICPHAERSGLRCLFKLGSLGSLRQLNRPAVLKLYDDSGGIFYGTLIGLQNDRATFLLGTEQRQVALNDLEAHWLGEFTLFWQVPPDYGRRLRQGDQGPAVSWLEEKMAILQGRTPRPAENLVFDDILLRQVEAFQQEQGLKKDGIVGPQTLIRLHTLVDGKTPLLVVTQEEG